MALSSKILNRIFGAVVNATPFFGTSLGYSMLRDDGGKEHKRNDLAEKQLQKVRDEWNEDQMKRLDFINKRLREIMRQGHKSTMLMTSCLNTIEYLQNK